MKLKTLPALSAIAKRGFLLLLVFSSSNLIGAESAQEQEQNMPENEAAPAQEQKANPRAKIQETVLGMNISGNKELPNVLYIVPWKSNAVPAALPKVNRLVDEIYAPVDPDVFSKQVNFYYQLTENKAEKDGEAE
ncbi:hypothetical protein [Aliikangiella sp. G2MR2-5]|uniref:hypothetical protein n=1 Tax=Aliikangiella sp. G2MR2-5 TaxID=2788943 RepID=UPI0018AC7797|nr:hypothetical protein [Aliikangiella sp. G2MR2-5]